MITHKQRFFGVAIFALVSGLFWFLVFFEPNNPSNADGSPTMVVPKNHTGIQPTPTTVVDQAEDLTNPITVIDRAKDLTDQTGAIANPTDIIKPIDTPELPILVLNPKWSNHPETRSSAKVRQ